MDEMDMKTIQADVTDFLKRLDKMSPAEQQAAALVEIAVELKWLRAYASDCATALDGIENKTM